MEENYKTHSTFWIFAKNSFSDFLVSKTLINFISKVILLTKMLLMCSEDPLSTEHAYDLQLLETSSGHRDELAENHSGDLFFSVVYLTLALNSPWTWDDGDSTLGRKNFGKTFWYLSFLCNSCINTWSLDVSKETVLKEITLL